MSDQRRFLSAFGSIESGWLEWLKWAEDVAQQLNLPLNFWDRIQAGREPSGKSLHYSHARAFRAAQTDDIQGMEFFSVPQAFKQLVFDWQLALVRNANEGFIFLGCDADHCSTELLLELAPRLLRHLNVVRYGFGGCVHKWKGPVFTSVGIGAGSGVPTTEEREDLLRWSQDLRGPRQYEKGYFRSAYEMNVLSRRHLLQHLGDSNLQTEIEQGRVPGTLLSLGADIFLWLLQDREIAPARSILRDGNLLVGDR